MKFLYFFIIFIVPNIVLSQSVSFKTTQETYKRVKTAYSEKEKLLLNLCDSLDLQNLSNDILIMAFKKEQKLEVWAKSKDSLKYNKLITYDFAGFSGELGPKRKEGDLQIPEGFYFINNFNPTSSFYLSLQVNYPNSSDKILSDKNKPGGEIFIHGNNCTVGCIPITDDKIMELYVLAVEAKNAGQNKIPVYIFPAKLNDNNFYILKQQYADNKDLIEFWENLKIGYDLFTSNQKELNFSINTEGFYIFK